MGLEYAEQLASRGYDILLVSNQEKELQDAAADIASRRGDELVVAAGGVTTVCPAAVATPLYRLKPSLMKLGVKAGVIKTPDWLVRRALKGMFRKRALLRPGFMNIYLPPLVALLPRPLEDRLWKRFK